MELSIQKRSPAMPSPEIEDWNDDDFESLEDVQFRTASTATSIVSHPQGNHRDSISSRLSMRSDSNQGDENWDVLVDEQASIKDAVALARSKGIPLPANVPRSALEGGTIRRLRGKEIKKAIADDWSEDLDFASAPTQLKLAKAEDRDLTESLRQISAAFHSSPVSPGLKDGAETIRSVKSRPSPTPISLDQFKDNEEDDGFGEIPTIRVAKHRTPQKMTLFTSPAQLAAKMAEMENIEEDLELPANGQLKLSARKPQPRTPQLATDDFDMEWAEGSLGTRHAGKRGVTSNRSSSVSALSPSASSAFSAESEDEGLDGIVLPSGPIRFEEILKRKQQDRSPELISQHFPVTKRKVSEDKESFFDDFVMPDGEVFDAARLTLNRNVKHKTQRPQSPGKRTATTLSFTTNKQQATLTRLPRFQGAQERHDRARSNLEPVSETGVPVQKYHRPGSRLGHIPHSSVSSIPAPSTPTPSTPSRRVLRTAESRPDIRYEPATTTNAQLLRAKRSMPVIRNLNSPTKIQQYNRPPSRQDGMTSRLNTSRPKTPTERSESRLAMERRGTVPFLPGGSSLSQSQHVSTKPAVGRHPRRNDSEGSNESMSAAQRSLSRIAGFRPDTPGKGKATYTAAELAAQAKKTMTKPARKRNFGDGSELEIFDDLPTSAAAESKFTKQPVGRGAPKSLRSKLGQAQFAASTTSLVSARAGNESPMPTTPMSPFRSDFATPATTHTSIPRFARDTAASRNAREQRQISTTFQNVRGEPLQPISANWKPQPTLRPNSSLRNKKRNVQQKPHLIKPMGNDVNRPKEEKGMSYNPAMYRWEGNENALAPFDVPEFNPRDPSPVEKSGHGGRGSPNNKSNMALIMNVGGTSGVQVVGGMVFDPRQMKWLKVAEGGSEGLRGGSGSVQLEEEEDVFAGLEDLKEEDTESIIAAPRNERQQIASPEIGGIDLNEDVAMQDVGNNSGHSGDEWPGVAEEFDVGPAFIKRQRDEEDRWRRKVEKWLRSDHEVAMEEVDGPGGWRWAIRDLICEGMTSSEVNALV